MEVTRIPLPDYNALAAAFKQLTDWGFTGELKYMERPGGEGREFFLTVQRPGLDATTVFIGDELVSIGGGVLMTEAQYTAIYGES